MHEYIFTDALLPASVSVLRLTLKPFCLGHQILLIRERNAFLTHSETQFNALPADEQKRQLRMAALICSKSWTENHQRDRGLTVWKWLVRNANYPVEIAHLRLYLASAHESVFYTLNPKNEDDVRADDICADAAGYEPLHKLRGRSLGAPLIARLLDFVATGDKFRAYGFPTPYDFPYGAALNLYLTHLEAEGSTRIEGHAEFAAKQAWAADVEWAREHEEKMEREKQNLTPDPSHPAPVPTGLATPPPDLNADEVPALPDHSHPSPDT